MKRFAVCLICFVFAVSLFPAAFAGSAAEESGMKFVKLEYSSAISGGPAGDSCYYSDGWFLDETGEYSDSLVLVSAQLSAAAGVSGQSVGLLKELGFADARAVRYGSPEPGDCAYTIGTKTIGGYGADKTLVAVVFQGSEYGTKGWQQNVTVNQDTLISADHASYASAADAFLQDLEETAISSDAVFWITGQSRGGAVANVVSARLLDRNESAPVFCCTFESPATTQNESAGAERYRKIRNYICDDDPVTMLPVWGMVRYGRDIVYNTAAPDEIREALVRQNADAFAVAEGYDTAGFPDGLNGFLKELFSDLEKIVPAREDYTRARTIALPDSEPLQYTYQEGLQALCRIIFDNSQEIAAVAQDLIDYMNELVFACVEEYAASGETGDSAALTADAARRRWNIAGIFCDRIAPLTQEPVRQTDFYAVLDLVIPLLVRLQPADEPGWTLPSYEDFDYMDYFNNERLMAIGMNAATMIFSHQPDVIIARLKLTAPAPAMRNVALEIPEPAAGDASGSAPAGAAASLAALGEPWLTVHDTGWLSGGDEPLANHRVCYLRITLDAVGHTIPEDFRFTLNGREPIGRTISYEDGSQRVTGIWQFRLGSPEEVSVAFDMNGHGETPEAIRTESGTILRYAGLKITDPGMVRDDTGLWSFDGWRCVDGSSWEDAAATGDILLQAGWTRMIDSVALSYEVPHIGETAEDPPPVTAPEGAPYRVTESRLLNGDYDDVTVVQDEEHKLMVFVFPTDDQTMFLGEEAEDGTMDYLGTVTVNGEVAADVSLYVDPEAEGADRYELAIEYGFHPLP